MGLDGVCKCVFLLGQNEHSWCHWLGEGGWDGGEHYVFLRSWAFLGIVVCIVRWAYFLCVAPTGITDVLKQGSFACVSFKSVPCVVRYSTVCYSMVQYGTLWYSMVQCGTAWYNTVHYGTVWYSMVRSGTVWSTKLKYGAVWYSMVQYSTIWYSTILYGRVWYSVVLHGTVWYSVVQCGTV